MNLPASDGFSSVAVVAIVTALVGPVAAADVDLKAPPPARVSVVDWTGFYFGGHVGYGGATFRGGTVTIDCEGCNDIPTGNYHPNGIALGFHAGYNWQLAPSPWGSWVVGIEGDASVTPGWQKNRCVGQPGSICDNRIVTGQLDWLSSIRGRLGMTFDRTLIYVTGGVAFAKNRQTACSDGTTCAFVNGIRTGAVVGGGIEWKYNPSLSLRLEGLHYIFNESRRELADNNAGGIFGELGLRNVSVIRVGVSWHPQPW